MAFYRVKTGLFFYACYVIIQYNDYKTLLKREVSLRSVVIKLHGLFDLKIDLLMQILSTVRIVLLPIVTNVVILKYGKGTVHGVALYVFICNT